ncbi:MAG: ABC transporter substrate-binding protein [Nitrospiraceae bacterium]|nr:ABC transporter substrate-binding protein [Nitrospiraceae bacterium]
MGELLKIRLARIQSIFAEFFGLGRTASLSAIILISLIMILAVYWFFHSAPPKTIIITSGQEGSLFYKNAEKYAKILARNGVKLKIIPSQGSLENLKRLSDPSFRVDVGFVQGGLAAGINTENIVSLGSIFYEPLRIFYISAKPIDLLSQFEGKRIAIGEEGSGTRAVALALLAANGIKPNGSAKLLNIDGEDAAKALLEGKADAIFLMADSASGDIMRKLMRAPSVKLFNFTQADGYTRRIRYLSKLYLPKGTLDFGKNLPAQDVYLVSPTVELIVRADIHPALSDLLLEAAREIHGRAGLFQKKGEFPAPIENEFRISDDAARFYKSGKSFLYRYLPFWLASLVNRILVVFVPLIILLIPGFRIIPALYRWKIKLSIYRWYRALLRLEQDILMRSTTEKNEEILGRLDNIEKAVNSMKVPVSFAEQFYVLRGHIGFVRSRLTNSISCTE